MIDRVIKRDGSVVKFDSRKIVKAIECANKEVEPKEMVTAYACDQIARHVRLVGSNKTHVEAIQDLVERELMCYDYFAVAKRYMLYRERRAMVRKANTTDESILQLIRNQNKEMEEENSNKNTRLASTQRDYIAGIVSRDITKRLLLPEHISKAHEEGVLHFHDADYFISPIFNCFSSKTRFVTDSGVVAFNQCRDGESVKVLDKNGVWRDATVRKYGKQRLYDVEFTAGRMRKTVVCTANHRWILKDGSVTTSLRVGDKLWRLPDSTDQWRVQTKRDAEMFAMGFVIGDGSDNNQGNVNRLNLRLCGDKTKYGDIFELAGFNVSPGKNTDDLFCSKPTKTTKQAFLTEKVWACLSHRDKAMLFLGYYAADGCHDRNACHTADERIMEMVTDISATAGYHVSRCKEIIHDTNFKKGAHLFEIGFVRHQGDSNPWTVKSIKSHRPGYVEQDVWCVEEPITHSFTLEGGIVTGNCCLINIADMLDNGTVLNGKMIESPKSFQVACTVMTQIIACIASNQYGGQSVDLSHLGKYLHRSIEKFKAKGYSGELLADRIREEVAAGVQTIQYQINTLMTTNGQSPFVTLFLNLKENDPFKGENALIIEEVLKQRLRGIKNEKGVYITPAFPKLVYVLTEENCLKGGMYDYLTKLAVQCSAKRMYPDYISAKKMAENYEGNVFSPMGCRSFLSPWKDENGNYKFEGRFNQGVVSINLPQIAILAGGNEDKFWSILDQRLELCKEALMLRHKALLGTKSDISPIHWQHGALARLENGEVIDPLLFGGYSSISLGYVGIYEMTKLMKGCSHTEPDGQSFALRVMFALKKRVEKWKQETNIGFALYGTPAESLCYRFAEIDRKRFGDIPDITDKGYYTNSYHVDVREDIGAFEKFLFESQFQSISTGGCIAYVEIPNMRHNLKALEDVVRFIYDNIQYAEFNTKSDYCQVCGYDGEIVVNEDLEWECPACHNKDKARMNVTRRTCGLTA